MELDLMEFARLKSFLEILSCENSRSQHPSEKKLISLFLKLVRQLHFTRGWQKSLEVLSGLNTRANTQSFEIDTGRTGSRLYWFGSLWDSGGMSGTLAWWEWKVVCLYQQTYQVYHTSQTWKKWPDMMLGLIRRSVGHSGHWTTVVQTQVIDWVYLEVKSNLT